MVDTYRTFNNGVKVPNLGLGVYDLDIATAAKTVYDALDVGYRLIDTARYYGNEEVVSQGIGKWLEDNKGKFQRSDVYYTTKIADEAKGGYEATKRAIADSLERAKPLGYIDLLLVHTPLITKDGRLEAWKAFQEAVESGQVKSIGVSNYGIHHLEELLNWGGLKIKPVVNQIELNPWLCRKELVSYCTQNSIALEAYSPLMKGKCFDEPVLINLAKKHNRDIGQILIRWSLQMGFIVIPKTSRLERLKSNFNVFDFELSDEDMTELTHPNENRLSFGWDPINMKD